MDNELPDGLEKYGETVVFTQSTVPAKLTSVHNTKAGVWGKLIILSGALRYIQIGPPQSRWTVNSGDYQRIEPQVPHRVEMIGPVEFRVEFYRTAKT